MAARFCKECQINWPVTVVQCTKCGGSTQSFAWRSPDPEVAGKDEEKAPEYDRIIAWRASCFRDLGVDWDTSFVLAAEPSATGAGGFEVDLGRFRELQKKGWAVADIVGALG
jgi:hypothetical protein